jgi:pantoate--beta-alanine ligase
MAKEPLIFRTAESLKAWVATCKRLGLRIGFVPTMGALHEGHLSLVEFAGAANEEVIVSIFVNPTQFNNREDLQHYPRREKEDLLLLAGTSCSAVFLPEVNEVYHELITGHWDFGSVTNSLEGFHRPGHFDGVCTIVSKLFNLIQPDTAYFGKKDYQQLAVIKALVKAEGFPVQIIACDTKRESNGLAMSSRNLRLTDKGRTEARMLNQILCEIQKSYLDGELPAEMIAKGKSLVSGAPSLQLEYLEVVDSETFERVDRFKKSGRYVALLAAYVEGVRLIDNAELIASHIMEPRV